MTVRVRKRASSALGFCLVASILATLFFGALFAAQRDWLAGVFMTVSAIAALRLGLLKLQLMRQGRAQDAACQDESTATGDGMAAEQAFVTAARQQTGLRVREGYVLIGRDVAGFVPTEEWRSALAEIGIGLVATRIDLTKTEFSAIESPALAQDFVALIESRDGLLLDASWVWSRQGKWLAHESSKTLVILNDSAPSLLAARWPTATTSPAKQRSIIRRVLLIGSGVVALLVGAGVVAWQLTDNSDFLIAGISFAGLVAIGVGAGLVAAKSMQSG